MGRSMGDPEEIFFLAIRNYSGWGKAKEHGVMHITHDAYPQYRASNCDRQSNN